MDSRRLRHTVMCHAAKKVTCNTRVLFTCTKIAPIFTSRILKTSEQISTKFTSFMLYIYFTLHTKFYVDCASVSRDIHSWKSPDFLRIFLLLFILCTKIKIFVKNIFSCFEFGTKIILVLDFISMKFSKI